MLLCCLNIIPDVCRVHLKIWNASTVLSKHEGELSDGKQEHDERGTDEEQADVKKSSNPDRENGRRKLQQAHDGTDPQRYGVQLAEVFGWELAVQVAGQVSVQNADVKEWEDECQIEEGLERDAGRDVKQQQTQIDQNIWQRIYFIFCIF